MEIKKHEKGSTVIPDGNVNLVNAEELKQTLLSLYEQGCSEITVDFSNITIMDSAGLGKLLLVQKKLRERGGSLRIVNIKSENPR